MVGVLAALLRVLGLDPGNHTVARSHLWWGLALFSGESEDSCSVLAYNDGWVFGLELSGD